MNTEVEVKKQICDVKITVSVEQVWQTLAAYELIRREAAFLGLWDVGQTEFQASETFTGATPAEVENLTKRLETLGVVYRVG
jgi:hypothetical protein